MTLLDPLPSPSGRPSRLATRLRLETGPHHDAIEANACLRRLLAEDLELGEYATILDELLGFYAPVEEGLRQWSGSFPEALELEARLCKSSLLQRDLLAIGVSSPRLNSQRQCQFGSFGTIEAAWGCLYVIEGAALGGQIIAKDLRASLGVTHERGASFHTPYGASTGARWQSFKAILTEEATRGALNEDAVVLGAKAAFAALDAWMSVAP